MGGGPAGAGGGAVRVDGGWAAGGGAGGVGGEVAGGAACEAADGTGEGFACANRFTFGPRPGDVAAVESMGLQRWFEMQLHPERIDDSGFVAEMGQFPAMGLPEEELKKRFPSGQMIRQMGRRGESVPGDPVEGAIYGDAEAVYREKVENKAVNGPAGVGVQGVVAGPTLAAKSGGDDGAPGGSVETHVSEARHGAPGSVAGAADDGKAVMNGTLGGPVGTQVSEARHGAPGSSRRREASRGWRAEHGCIGSGAGDGLPAGGGGVAVGAGGDGLGGWWRCRRRRCWSFGRR